MSQGLPIADLRLPIGESPIANSPSPSQEPYRKSAIGDWQSL